MNLIDMRTVFFIIMVVTGVVTLFLTISWRQNASRYEGMIFFVGDFFFQTIGEFLISLRGFIPNLFSIVISNTLIIFASILGYIGLEYYLNKKTGHKFNIFMILCFASIISYFTFANPNLGVRSLMIGVFWLINNIRSLHLMLYRAEKSTLNFTKPLIHAYVLFMCLSSARIIEYFINRNPSTEYFQSGAFERFVLFFILIVVISLTYGINLSLKLIRKSTVLYENKEISYTFSAGVSDTFEFSKESLDIEVIINQADSRLYDAKNNGRDQVRY